LSALSAIIRVDSRAEIFFQCVIWVYPSCRVPRDQIAKDVGHSQIDSGIIVVAMRKAEFVAPFVGDVSDQLGHRVLFVQQTGVGVDTLLPLKTVADRVAFVGYFPPKAGLLRVPIDVRGVVRFGLVQFGRRVDLFDDLLGGRILDQVIVFVGLECLGSKFSLKFGVVHHPFKDFRGPFHLLCLRRGFSLYLDQVDAENRKLLP